ncbi:hypothetical protein VNO80_25038 [Phaseolus coccineus]|uniref:Uncharacterized protein n=1 Tax=Phaseolus coccineus TaxID=3886 RepID=A0AAN9QLK9_PHACN
MPVSFVGENVSSIIVIDRCGRWNSFHCGFQASQSSNVERLAQNLPPRLDPVEAGRENHHQCDTHGGHHDRTMTVFDLIKRIDDEFSERGLENEGQNMKHFAENRSVE